MDVNPNKYKFFKKIEFYLVFFLVIYWSVSCLSTNEKPKLSLQQGRNGAANVYFAINNKSYEYKVILKEGDHQQAVLGSYEEMGDGYKFVPIIPFTSGKTYKITENGEDYLEFSVDEKKKNIDRRATKILKIYPEVDTVPENLLKMYFSFSRPMQQSESFLNYVTVFDQKTKEPQNIFLRLENELWNKEHTEVTLWLDPGRIKQDLIPNKELGKPIIKGRTYEIVILNTLQDYEGERINKTYGKVITVGQRDSKKPVSENWTLTLPAQGTKEGLGISFDDILDANMISETFQIYNAKNEIVKGGFLTSKKAKSTLFIPKDIWKRGTYKILIDSRQEDLAGNNFNRLFDTDLQVKKSLKPSATQEILFTVD